MKILILQDDFPPRHIGGSGSIAYALAQELRKRGHEVEVVTAVQDRALVGETTYEGIPVHNIFAPYSKRFNAYTCLWNPPAIRELTKILANFKPEIVHAHSVNGYLSYGSLVIAKKSGARVVLTCHDVMAFNYSKLTEFIDPDDTAVHERYDYRVSAFRQLRESRFRYNPFRNIVIRHILHNYVDVLTAVSDALRQALEDNGVPGAVVIHNGIDVAEWKENPARDRAFKERHGLGDSVILFGGRISGIKGTDKILDALARVRTQVPDVQLLVIAKEGESLDRMRALAKERAVAEALVAPGWLSGDDLKATYHASAVVAVPTLSFDSFPTMNLEAFACTKPVVATCFGGSRELVEDDISGYIVNPYNVPMLAEKITDLLSDKSKAERFGEKGLERVAREFTLEKQAEGFEKLYR
ncbi:MAG: glycosyltransferase family 4 protein [Patescibacteria group bacterium]